MQEQKIIKYYHLIIIGINKIFRNKHYNDSKYGFSDTKSYQYYINNINEKYIIINNSFNKDMESDPYFYNPYALDNMVKEFGIYTNKSLIFSEEYKEDQFYDKLRISQNQQWASERNIPYIILELNLEKKKQNLANIKKQLICFHKLYKSILIVQKHILLEVQRIYILNIV